MFKNYFTVALRNLVKHKFFSVINIFGLTVGIASCLLIFIYVTDEVSYDKFHVNAENIYRIGLHGKIAGQEIYTTNSSLPLGPAMRNEIPGVESMTRVDPFGRTGVIFRNGEKVFTEKDICYADSNFFKFFSFRLKEGDAETALNEPNAVVISQTLADKYFDGQAFGKTLVIGNDKKAFKVTGISDVVPANSHLQFNAILSYNTILRDSSQSFNGWTSNSMYTYIQKSPLTKPEEINRKLENMVEKYVGKELEQGLGIKFAEFRKGGGIYSYEIYPLTNSHLHAYAPDDMQPAGNITYVYIFSGVGIFILLLACINFMNLSTAQSAGRAKEVGLRKTLGSLRSQLIGQFLSESFIFSFVAVILAVALCYLVLPYFNLLAGKELTLVSLNSPSFFAAAAVLIVFVGFLAGSYPAFYLTSFNVVEVVKGKIRAGMKSKGVRSSLVVFQFAVSILLILATAVVYLQLTYMQDKDLGLDKRNVLDIQSTGRLDKNRMAFRNEVKNLAGVQAVSFTGNTFPGINNTTVFREKGSKVDHLTGKYSADWDHMDVLKFKLSAGRFFSRDYKTDSTTAVVNEAFVKEFGWKDALGQEVIDFNGATPETVKIIGVVKDFNFETLKDKVRPIIMRLTPESRDLLVRYEGNPKNVTESIEKLWRQYSNGEPFEYAFLDEGFDRLFRAEQRLRDIFTVFSVLAISIACLGLFALAAFTTEQRTKEIGIRKAMGASVAGLTLHLSKEFMVLVLVAMIPAVGLGWYFAESWLSDFPYRIVLSPLVFIGSALTAIFIAWLTVSYQSLKAARAKPVNSLRYE
ncbi:ABC transporter permease [Cytophagales bacterium WSM2-2]|nr:ABC transporter permease [Cytophagales bacterium WSM2-2]